MDSREHSMWKEIFFKDNFNVDQCLTKYTQKTDLESLRTELKNYAVELHQQMAEILKTETETIVNLAEYLTNLNSKIGDLALPVSQLQEEIKTLYNLMKNAKEEFEESLNTMKVNSTEKNHLKLKLGIISACMYLNNMKRQKLSEDLSLLERAVSMFSSQKNYLDHLQIITPDIEDNINEVGSKLVEILNAKFVSALKNIDASAINRCLHMYDNLGRHDAAEHVFQIDIVRPELQKILCESNLARNNQSLDKLHEELLNFMDTHMGTLSNVIESYPELNSFNFVLRSFWLEVDKQSREGLQHIAAPGNPDLFQRRFQSTWDLCTTIAERSGDANLIRKDDTFRNYIKRYNLPVYFEIRFQQVAGNFEKYTILKADNDDIYASDGLYKLKVSSVLHSSVLACFSKDIFIEHLSDQFLKLSMLLLSRYLRWFDTILAEESVYTKNMAKWEMFVITSLSDLDSIQQFVGTSGEDLTVIDKSPYAVIPVAMKPVVLKILKLNHNLINQKLTKFRQYIEKLKGNECLSHLQNVSSIPRLYRRTNKTAPKEASNYMLKAVKTLRNFNERFEPLLEKNFDALIDSIIVRTTEDYLYQVQQVLNSVCKTEESLRRLKSRTLGASEDATQSADTMSDETKIREQIKLDVLYFINQLHSIGGDASRKSLDLLREKTIA